MRPVRPIIYPTRCRIIDVIDREVSPGIVGRTPEASKPHIGKLGTAWRMADERVKIDLDNGGELFGSECWWVPVSSGETRHDELRS